MADIHHLPLASLGGSGLWRLTQELAASFEAGEDLGSRVLHIHASAHALDELSDRLEASMADLADLADLENELGLYTPALIIGLQGLAKQCRRLSHVSSTFPRTHELNPTRCPKPRV